jgi:hypothetical protein
MNAYMRFTRSLAGMVLGLSLCFLWIERLPAQGMPEFQQTKRVALQEMVLLEVDIETGQLQILYNREGEVSLSVSMQGSPGAQAGRDYSSLPLLEQNGNHITIRVLGGTRNPRSKTTHYRLDVPYRTEVVSRVGSGTQEIRGIMGPVRAVTESGDTHVSYVSQDVAATAEKGNLDFDVIGGRIQARVHRGNISCTRAAQGIEAESEQGDITLMAVGSSTAKVKEGSGRIEVSGARASFWGSTDAGDIHVKAVVHDDWKMNSKSGSIRIELPSKSSFLLDASTLAGEMLFDRDDLEKADAGAHHINQAVSGGRNRIEVHTETGQVAIR